MKGFLVDTCIISELAKRSPAREVVSWFENTSENLYLSAITVEEFLTGLRYLGSETKLTYFRTLMDEEYQTLPVTDEVTERSSLMRYEARKTGAPMGLADALIAATASLEDLTLVTRNVKDFSNCGVPLLNPFE
jgi:predicted nucleic acid-binding protein